MQRKIQVISSNLAGYQPYNYVTECNGVWTPFNQSTSGYVGVMSIFKAQQMKHRLPNPIHDLGVCQGISLFYIENNGDMSALSQSGIELGQIKPKRIARAVNQQAAARSTEDARKVMIDPAGKLQCKLEHADHEPKQFNLYAIFKTIEGSSGNVFYLTGYCDGQSNGVTYNGAHAFVIMNDGYRWKLFDALRGEVSFGTYGEFKKWLVLEVNDGVLNDLGARYPVDVKPNTSRRYSFYTLDCYSKVFGHDLTPKMPYFSSRL